MILLLRIKKSHMKSKTLTRLFKDTFDHWNAHPTGRMAAALSYYTIFSIAPLLIVMISITSIFFGREIVESNLFAHIQSLLGPNTEEFIRDLLLRAYTMKAGVIAIIVSIGTLIWSATGVFRELNNSLDELWETKRPIKVRSSKHLAQALWIFVKEKLLVFSVLPLLGIFLLVSVATSIGFHALGTYGTEYLHIPFDIIHIVEPIFSYLLTVFLFALIYRMLANIKLPWIELLLGAALTSLLFQLGEFLISYYLVRFADTGSYGAAGSMVAILLWVFYSAQILFFGASFTFIYSKTHGYLKKKML